MRLLSLTFDLPLQHRNIAGFRAAVAHAAGYDTDVFHNHLADGRLQYRYPMVQYRSSGGHAAILGLDEGADAIYDWYNASGNQLLWNEEVHDLRVKRLDVREFEMHYHEGAPRIYRLCRWLALNQARYREWQTLSGLQARVEKLDGQLAANILTFCRAVNWHLPERLEVSIQEIHTISPARFHGVEIISFDLTFSSNLILPFGLGLGKAVSHGFGVCAPLHMP